MFLVSLSPAILTVLLLTLLSEALAAALFVLLLALLSSTIHAVL